MPETLSEYAEELAGRSDLIWPKPPELERPKATAYLKPLAGIRAVTWSVYGTLLRIGDGALLLEHPQQLRMQIALEKTIKEFNMWNSMSRKPGAPWEYMFQQYSKLIEDARMSASVPRGDKAEVDSAGIWKRLIERLVENDYEWEEAKFGDVDDLAEKVAYFFHSNLQGVEAAPDALAAVQSVADAGVEQALLSDAQPFTLVQLLRALGAQGKLPALGDLFTPECFVLSFREGVRKPSTTLYQTCLKRFADRGVAPEEILHVGSNLKDDLGPAKRVGMRTALYAGDKSSLKATKEETRDPDLKPDRLLTDLGQIGEILGE